MPDLWPAEFGTVAVTPPIAILLEQAKAIASKTKGKIVGRVLTSKFESGLSHQFLLCVPVLDNYTYTLLSVDHAEELYPLQIDTVTTTEPYTCHSQQELEQSLQEIFQSDKTRRVIGSLLAQADAVLASRSGFDPG